jgi:hypothetical protein
MYDHLCGDLFLTDATYKVPESVCWPIWMKDMPLGEWAGVARVQQQILKNHYPERYKLLNEMDFPLYLPPYNLDEKYYEPLEGSTEWYCNEALNYFKKGKVFNYMMKEKIQRNKIMKYFEDEKNAQEFLSIHNDQKLEFIHKNILHESI